ncbi:unnamed protein product [Cuscuta campestris]|uniref:LOW protein: ammonium transporter 1-like protein n=1 Tax=Cuscuta campestris TaxID=132261 RepID=A0A484LST1_9ASTE|nr:unnamed protein product [Cuscuta campestris]
MASSAPSAVLRLRLSNHYAHSLQHIPRNSHNVPSLPCPSPSCYSILLKASFSSTVPFAVSDSDSAKSLEPDPRSLLREVADSFDLPADYLSRLPWDLRLDLNDAAFDLSNGPVQSECGEEIGETLLNISRAWELADTSTSAALMVKVTQLGDCLTSSQKSALGKRLLSAGRRFQSMGQYDKGEVQRIAEVMMRTGMLLSGYAVSAGTDEEPKQQTRTFKFGELEVALSSGKAYVGTAIGSAFGILCWGLSQRVASVPESSFQYANDNALLLAKSLQGFLLALLYSSTVLSAFVTIGLLLLAGQLKSSGK